MVYTLLFRKARVCLLLACLLTSIVVHAQTQLKGKVIGTDDQKPIAGATILLKGTTNSGTVTDAEGGFTLNVPANAVVVVSYIGYLTQEITVGNQTFLDVALAPTTTSLSEVVVTGYNTERKKDIIGSVSIVDMKALKSVPAGSAVQALQGQAAGVNVISSGAPGSPANIFIRGISSFGNTQPLVLIDGIQGELNDVSADDIESVQVLKDAGAAAIYGVRGSNGVLVVTTKKGKSGQPTLSYDAYYGTQIPQQGNVWNLLNSQDFARLTKIAYPNTGLFQNGLPDFMYRGRSATGVGNAGTPAVDPSRYNFDANNPANNYLIQAVNKTGTDWFHEVFKPAPITNHNLTASGGTDKSNYLVSLGYFNQQGTLLNTYLKRYSARVNTQFKVRKNIRVGENLYVFYKQNPGFDNLSTGNPIAWTYRAMPIIPVYDIRGNYGGTFAGPELGSSSNPVAVQNNTLNNKSNTWNVVGNVFAEVDFLKYFTARTSIGGFIDNQYYTNFTFTPYNNSEGNTNPNSFAESALYNSNTMWTNTLSFAKTLGQHSVKVIAGSEAIRNYGRFLTGSSSGLFSTNFDYLSLTNGTTNITNGSSAYNNTLFSLFTRLDYAYADKYLVGVTVRRDGSSRFGANKRYGVFPSVSLGWRVKGEKFMEDVTWIDDLKLRGSYGVLGSQNNVSPQNAFTLFGGTFFNAYYDISGAGRLSQGFAQTSIGNPNTGWEENIVQNIGLDATFLNNRLDLSLEYYKKSINGLLFSEPLPATAGGATPPTVNIGDIQNKGFDANLTYRGTVGTDLRYSIGANITTYQNTVVNIPGPGYFDAANTQNLGNVIRNQEGQPVSSFFGYKVMGLFKNESEVTSAPAQSGAAPGRFRYADINGDNKIDANDRTFLGSPNPAFTYGLNLGLTYRNFDFSSVLYGSQGNEIYNTVKSFTHFFSTYVGGKSNDLLNAWSPENPNSNIPKIESTGSFSSSGVSNSFYVENGSFLKLRSLVIGYTISPAQLRKIGLNKLRVYAQGANLFTLTKYTGLDPEISGLSSAFGVDYANYPGNQKNFIFGLNLSF
ncbi:SusC/RagA family TonB-linked outer membrane protein [Rudanella paleaurantiibacter]|uniref:SusC/RagA family TonB-linked outer membrane protein n=1 Tax=Rudanella paleaurantiibacter TaxID=2614655 RepID=A0A7J5U5M4_9BACT|nr:TonB-dependent receptor [Rudanella paleaurantiibacter]KAB7733144.1 SusC/RagA family TonB-linked outer membrane protein [Rudanella paleaurantiibacter]